MAKILVIDNEKDIRDFTIRFFTERNFDVLWADDIFSALPIVKKDRPDIALLSINSDIASGIEALKSILSASSWTRTVIISSTDNINVMQEALHSGAVAFLSKPILLSELMDIVLRNLRKNRRYFELKVEPKND